MILEVTIMDIIIVIIYYYFLLLFRYKAVLKCDLQCIDKIILCYVKRK